MEVISLRWPIHDEDQDSLLWGIDKCFVFSLYQLKSIIKRLPKKLPMVKKIAKQSCQIVLFTSKLKFEPSCFFIKCVLLRREQIQIPYLLTILLQIPLNILPCWGRCSLMQGPLTIYGQNTQIAKCIVGGTQKLL